MDEGGTLVQGVEASWERELRFVLFNSGFGSTKELHGRRV